MKYSVDNTINTPAYIQLYRQIKKDITEGIYKYGEKLPSKRLLAEESGTSVITAEHTYSILCDEGYTEARQRSGYFVIYRKRDFIGNAADNPRHFTPKTAVGVSSCSFPFSVMAKTMRKVLSEYAEAILVKSPNHGCRELREAIAAYLAASNGIKVGSEQIIIGSGAEYLYSLIVQLLGRERIFALESPSYDKIRRVYHAHGVECEMLKMSNDGIKSSELERSRATVLHVTPFNSFPSNISASISKRNEYIHWAKERNGYIVEDNFDSELTVSKKTEDTVFSLENDGRVIYLNTFSKTIAPSVRIGYMILPETLLPLFHSKLDFYSCTVPVFEQYVLAELITSGDFERHINRERRSRRKNLVI